MSVLVQCGRFHFPTLVFQRIHPPKTHNIIKLSFLLPPQQSGWTEKGLPAPPENSRSNNSVDSVTVGDFWSTFGRLRLGLFCSSFLAQRPNAAKSEPKATWELTDRNSESIRINQKRSQGTLQMARWRKALRNILGRTCQQLNGWNSKTYQTYLTCLQMCTDHGQFACRTYSSCPSKQYEQHELKTLSTKWLEKLWAIVAHLFAIKAKSVATWVFNRHYTSSQWVSISVLAPLQLPQRQQHQKKLQPLGA